LKASDAILCSSDSSTVDMFFHKLFSLPYFKEVISGYNPEGMEVVLWESDVLDLES
jgi:hypothetical protein